MHRLLYTLTQDRKISYAFYLPAPLRLLTFASRLDTWQSALRKQYLRRDPNANPLGPEPPAPSRMQSRDPTTPPEDNDEEDNSAMSTGGPEPAGPSDTVNNQYSRAETADTRMEKLSTEEAQSSVPLNPNTPVANEDDPKNKSNPPATESEVESRNWLDLPMLEKLDSLHLVTEWQFQNPHRLRSLMRDDGDHGLWVSSVAFMTRPVFIYVDSESSLSATTRSRMHIG